MSPFTRPVHDVVPDLMTICPGQTYRAVEPLAEGRRIRIDRYTPGHAHAWVVDAQTGTRGRWILVSSLHQTAVTRTGQPRRTGYVLETL
ncbi:MULTISPECIES: hypothetical protein [Streptomyces]|uniref:Uncharacterized protein n=2 Tax=Streptomyces TaxID=1883 RepID=A0A124ECQ8_9ACTN|nr:MULTISPECIES: hypothetical protein [Streptomyces]KUH38407.1 hypothetical protein ATE80_13135 [Streptomyces kanasensis]UUS30854.1 hypothetical protein NRO40_08400 [Streptomyces changanensis]